MYSNLCYAGEEVETDSVWARLEDAMDAVSELAELKEEREEPDISMSAALAMNGWRSDWFTVEVRDVGLLCHKDSAQGTQSTLLGSFLAFRCEESRAFQIKRAV